MIQLLDEDKETIKELLMSILEKNGVKLSEPKLFQLIVMVEAEDKG